MAIPANPPPPLSQAQSLAEDNGYVKRAVMAVVNAVRHVFEKISNFFSCCFSASEERPIASQAVSAAPPPAPAPLTRAEKLWNAFRIHPHAKDDYLEMLESGKFSPQERDDVYVSLAEVERAAAGVIGSFLNSCTKGDAREHKIAQGRQIARDNPYLLIPHLSQKI